MDFAEIIYRRALGLPVGPVSTYREHLGLWLPMHDLLAFRQLRSAGQLTTGGWLSSLGRRQVPLVLDLSDPGPTLTKFAQFLRWGRRRLMPDHQERSRKVLNS